jgi:tetratricopeptide (TPR) repeat protein
LVETALLSRRSEQQDKVKNKAKSVTDEACQGGNPLAYVARYQLRSFLDTKWEEALEDLNKAVEIDPNQPEVYFLRGIDLFQHDRHEEAIQDFTTFVDLSGNSSDASKGHIARAQCYTKLGEHEKAVEDLRRAAELRPKDEGVVLLLARALYSNHKYPEAEEAARKALELEPKFHKARIFSAHVLCALGERARATDELRQAMESGVIEPGDALDAAEAYLIVDPKESLRLLDRSGYGPHPHWETDALLLRALAAELLGEPDLKAMSMQSLDKLGIGSRKLSWSFAELKEFLEWGVARGCLTEEKRTDLKAMIEHFETSKPGK